MKDYIEKIKDIFRLKGDKYIWVVTLLLMVSSLAYVYTSMGSPAFNKGSGYTLGVFFSQFKIVFGAIVTMILSQRISWEVYYKFSYVIIAIALILLVAVQFDALGGVDINGSRRWIKIPMTSRTLQVSEFAKIAIIMYMSKILSKYQLESGFNIRKAPYLVPVFIALVLIFKEDFSTTLLISFVVLVLLILGRVSKVFILKIIGVPAILLIAILLLGRISPSVNGIARVGTINSRIDSFLGLKDDEKSDIKDDYQTIQAQIAIMRGGLTGVGVGASTQRNHLPYCYSDFIYAIIVEELGLIVVAIFVILPFMILFYRTVAVASKYLNKGYSNKNGSPSLFLPLLIIGLIVSLTLQAMAHMAVNTGLLPVTGQTLPFISHGGTSLFISAFAMSIIIGASYRITPEGENSEVGTVKWFSSLPFISVLVSVYKSVKSSVKSNNNDNNVDDVNYDDEDDDDEYYDGEEYDDEGYDDEYDDENEEDNDTNSWRTRYRN